MTFAEAMETIAAVGGIATLNTETGQKVIFYDEDGYLNATKIRRHEVLLEDWEVK